jgi:hypothetical protein
MRPSSHVSDDRLVEVCLELNPTEQEQAHFAACERCQARRLRLVSMFGETRQAAEAEADAIFTPERLAAQQARILQRIEQDGRPARVIAFPATQAGEQRPLRNRPAARWIAAAAAAGLAVGLLAGHLAHDLPSFGRPARPTIVSTSAARPVAQPTLRAVNASMNEEEFLGEIENALARPTAASLQILNDLTPQ